MALDDHLEMKLSFARVRTRSVRVYACVITFPWSCPSSACARESWDTGSNLKEGATTRNVTL